MFNNILRNIFGYDMIIILLAVFNGVFIIPRLRKYSNALRKKCQGTVYLPIQLLIAGIQSAKNTRVNIHELQELREKEVMYFHLFGTINSVFPLLGILGTIIGLLRMIGLESTVVMSNFTLALTSTFWGLVFAIIFKAIDGMLAPVFYQNQENLQLLYERIDMAYGEGYVDDQTDK
ncbi:MotA/TolQ/ExbB proton channel family protein [Vallitaleaceae bacterium 9-2]